jgi:membrane associated rhomboid family serine protease
MTVAPVGIRCPEHAGKRSTTPRPVRSVQRTAARRGFVIGAGDPIVTRILVAVNVVIYLIGVSQGVGINTPGGSLYDNWILYGPAVAQGDWWRLITATFLHANIIHIAFNMLALWWLGSPVELAIGRFRFVLLYFASGLAGSAGALLFTPNQPTLGASGAIFGLLGAGLILEWRATGKRAGQYLTLIVINLLFTVAVPNISIGGHLGGLVGGIVGMLALSSLARIRLDYRRRELASAAAMVAIGAISVAIAYLKVRGMA